MTKERAGEPTARRRRLSPLLVLTSLAWGVIAAAAGWVLVALGWWLLANIWAEHILIPRAVTITALFFLLLVVWGLLHFLLALAWSRHEYRRYHLADRRRIRLPTGPVEVWGWAEGVRRADGSVSFVARGGLRAGPGGGQTHSPGQAPAGSGNPPEPSRAGRGGRGAG